MKYLYNVVKLLGWGILLFIIPTFLGYLIGPNLPEGNFGMYLILGYCIFASLAFGLMIISEIVYFILHGKFY